MKKATTKFVFCFNTYFIYLTYVFLKVPICGGIFSAIKSQKRIEELEKNNPFRRTINEPDHFEADVTEETFKKICDPTMKSKKKLKKNWIDVRKCKIFLSR